MPDTKSDTHVVDQVRPDLNEGHVWVTFVDYFGSSLTLPARGQSGKSIVPGDKVTLVRRMVTGRGYALARVLVNDEPY